ncbi:ABC transporter ATP-binding protein [Bacillus thuringiensis]|uniref:ABC transporter ATP-binding protein n=1 Tax=Bacillus thuringiensis TaxID=1428 RepID=UPI000D031DE0|nr:ABC transporter ATP-binding protein [Bacillus thuringiensis]PRT25350.1 ABC transporter ATP-binding protein [Bacillus thuringiensis]
MFLKTYKKFSRIVFICKEIVKIIYKIAPLYLFVIVSFTIFAGISPVIYIYISQNLINSIVNSVQGEKFPIEPFIYLGIQLMYFFLEKTIFHFEKIYNYRMLQQVEYYFNNINFEKIINLSLIFFDDSENYNTLMKSTLHMGKRSCELIRNLLQVVQSSVTIIGFLISLLYFHWILVLCMLGIIILLIAVNTNVAKKGYNQFLQQIQKIRKLEYLERLFKTKEVQKEIKIFNHGRHLIKEWKKIYWECANEQYKLEKTSNYRLYGSTVFQLTCNTLFIGMLIFYVIYKKINIGQFVALTQMFNTSVGVTNQLVTGVSGVYSESLFISEYFKFKEKNFEIQSKKYNIDQNSNVYKDIKISVNNISFKYPHQDFYVINDISFEIKPGSKVAIVGRNGAGKSTLIKCLTGLYDVSEGEVLYNDMPVTNEARLKTVSAIFQDFHKYEMSFLENICFTNIQNTELNKLQEVIHLSNANSILQKHKIEYDSLIGSTLYGKELSGGEWQKIALSRAMYKESEIIIMDEPTAALDPLSEAKVIDKFYEISEGKTAIFVTHRLGSCVNADLIIVLKDGKLIEKGTHNELLNLKGEYAELFNTQAKWYKDELVLQEN